MASSYLRNLAKQVPTAFQNAEMQLPTRPCLPRFSRGGQQSGSAEPVQGVSIASAGVTHHGGHRAHTRCFGKLKTTIIV